MHYLETTSYIFLLMLILGGISERFTEFLKQSPNRLNTFVSVTSAFLIFFLFYNRGMIQLGLWWLSFGLSSVILVTFINELFKSRVPNYSKSRFSKLLASINPLGNLNNPVSSSRTVITQEKIVLNLGVSTALAFLFQANLFDILQAQRIQISWDSLSLDENWMLALTSPIQFSTIDGLGILMTAVFVSFVSKFLHDGLKHFHRSRKANQEYNEQRPLNIGSIMALDQVQEMTDGEIVRAAIKQNREWIEKVPNYVSLHMGFEEVENKPRKIACIDVSGSEKPDLPESLNLTLPDGSQKTIPLKVITNVRAPEATNLNGSKIANSDSMQFEGTLGCALFDAVGRFYFLTCDHVLTGGGFDENTQIGLLDNEAPIVIIDENGSDIIGDWYWGLQSSRFDIGLIKARNSVEIKPSGLSKIPEFVDDNDVGSKVTCYGAFSGKKSGYLLDADVPPIAIKFSNRTKKMSGLMIIGKDGQSISRKGDSGAVLYNESKNAVGMIVGANDQYSFAIPMFDIINATRLRVF